MFTPSDLESVRIGEIDNQPDEFMMIQLAPDAATSFEQFTKSTLNQEISFQRCGAIFLTATLRSEISNGLIGLPVGPDLSDPEIMAKNISNGSPC